MLSVYIYTLIAILAVSLISLVVLFALSLNDKFFKSIVPLLVSIATGALLGDAFIHLIPESLATGVPSTQVGLLVIVGVLLFFILEKVVHWHHHHDDESAEDEHHHHDAGQLLPVGQMVLLADGLHNFIDGLIIGASFLISIPAGIASTIAIIFHEIPQEIGDFGILVHSGYSKGKALWLNAVSATTAFLGGIIVLALSVNVEHFSSYALPVAAGSFIYLALADLIPELHKVHNPESSIKHSLAQLAYLIIGVLIMLALLYLNF